jgi:DNA mismatch repair protein MutS
MKQYYEVKAKHPGAILLFRVGDFYETFSDDAILASKILGITLTRRANGSASYVELAGFPYHSLDNYLPKLVRAGQRVAICEQLEDPKLTKKIVKRGVTELVTPGVSLDDNILDHKENNFLCSLHISKHAWGIALLDISTGEFLAAEGSAEYIDKLISNFSPKEIIFERSKESIFEAQLGSKFYTYKLDDWIYTDEAANERLLSHFQTNSLKGFGLEGMNLAAVAAGAVLHYLDLTEHRKIDHIKKLSRIAEENYVWLDKFTIRNLELFGSMNQGGRGLLDVIDRTVTPMGSRMMRRWLAMPLKKTAAIKSRLDAVELLFTDTDTCAALQSHVHQICDLERIISRVATGRISPREIVQLHRSLSYMQPIKYLCAAAADNMLRKIGEQLNPCSLISSKIETSIQPDPPALVSKGGVIAQGIDAELDELRDIAFTGKDYLLKMQIREEERSGIPKLKVAFNNVFGYFIEVRNTHKDKVPPDWIRKQTLVGAERYITEELKEYEAKILGAEEKIQAIETRIFSGIVQEVAEYIEAIQLNANLISQLDCLQSLASVAAKNRYTKPEVNEGSTLDIVNGRHPVIETQLPAGEEYIANSLQLDRENQQIIIVTGPNMAGKSALLRQTAIISIMAQIGSFVPAESAKIGWIDKIFTRVGASDNISSGESTFMVEMNEAASILNNISDRSLVLFDELGRGTSTYDGISIAWSIVEYLHNLPAARPKTLFATHYHELNDMESMYERIKNYNVSIKEAGGKIHFIRKLVKGGSEHSFGIHVAKLAGMPKSVIDRANEVLGDLEQAHSKHSSAKPSKMQKSPGKPEPGMQLSFFQLEDPVLLQIKDQIAGIDINNLTPLEALNKLSEIKKCIGVK